MARRILHKFKLNEISGVDRMAMAGAKLVLMKRDDAFAKAAFMDAVQVMEARETVRHLWEHLWESETAIYDAIWNIQNNPERYPNVEAAIIEALGEYSAKVQEQAADAAATVPSKGVEKSAPTDPAIQLDQSDGDNDTQTDPKEDAMSKKEDPTVETLTVELAGVTELLTKANTLIQFNDADKAHYGKLNEDAQIEFAKMDEGARANVHEGLAKADPVVYTADDGEEFHKSDDPRLVKMAKRSDDDRKIAKEEREKTQTLELTKRADDELSHLPGDAAAKIELLKAIDGISDEAARKTVGEILKAADSGVSGAFDTHGTTDIAKGDAETQLNTLTTAYAKDNSVSEALAMVEVLKTNEGERLYTETQS